MHFILSSILFWTILFHVLLYSNGNINLTNMIFSVQNKDLKLTKSNNYDIKLIPHHKCNYKNNIICMLVDNILYNCNAKDTYDIADMSALKNESYIVDIYGSNIAKIIYDYKGYIIVSDLYGQYVAQMYNYNNDVNLWHVNIYNNNHKIGNINVLSGIIGKFIINSDLYCSKTYMIYESYHFIIIYYLYYTYIIFTIIRNVDYFEKIILLFIIWCSLP